MEETGGIRFQQGGLDPRAQEFRPRIQPPIPATFALPPPTVFFPYATFPPPPYLPTETEGYPPPYTSYVSPPLLPPPSTAATRTLVLSSVPDWVMELTLRRDMEVFGEVRAVQMERSREGIVTVHFYDLRNARRALREIRDQHMLQQCRLRDHHGGGYAGESSPRPLPAPGLVAGRAVWAQYIIPASNAIPEGQNQGTIVVFNLNPDVSPDVLREIFEAFGPVKEFRDTPYKKHQKFVEFFDVRDAAKALVGMNGQEIYGRNVVIEFSRPGGHNRKFLNAVAPLPPPPPPLPRPLFVYPPMVPQLPHASPNGNRTPIEAMLGGLVLGFDGNNYPTEEWREVADARKMNGGKKKLGGKASSAASMRQRQNKSKAWKGGRKMKRFDNRFVINDDVVGDGGSGETRTTLMIKNIPNKYSQKLILNMLDAHCINFNEQIGEDSDENDGSQPLSSYDFVYLPIDFNNKCNVGYGFVNMTSPEAAWRLYKAFHLRHWEVFNSRKICEVTYARIQGLEALKEHFKNSKFPGEMDHYLPVVFSPPRDGRQLTEPLTIGGQRHPQKEWISGSPDSGDTDDSVGEDLLGGSSSIMSSGSCSQSSNGGGDNGDGDGDDDNIDGVTVVWETDGGRIIN